MFRGFLRHGLVLFVLATGCRGGATTPPMDLSDPAALVQQLEEHLRRHPEDVVAARGLAHVHWIHLGQTDQAVPILDALAKKGDAASRLSRLLIADARRESEIVREQAMALVRAAAQADPRDPQWAFLQHAAAVAARRLDDEHGAEEGDDARFVTFFEGLDLDRLSFEVRQPLLSVRAGIARRHEKDFRPYYDLQGCVREFEVGPLRGKLGELELASVDPSNFDVDPDATLVGLACVSRIWNPTRQSGYRSLRTWVDVHGDVLVLDLGAQNAMRVWVDGREVHRTDRTDRFPASRSTIEVPTGPGTHEVLVATAVPGEKAWVLVRAVDARGRPLPTHVRKSPPATWSGSARTRIPPWPREAGPLEGPLYQPLRAYLGVEAALADGDADRAERFSSQLRGAKQFPDGHLQRARFERADPSRASTVSSAREQRALERALKLDPRLDAARLRLYEIMLGRGDDDEVIKALAKLPKDRLAGLDGQMLRYRVHRAAGNDHLAESVLDRLAREHPKNCKVLVARRSVARGRDDVREEDRLTEALRHCSGSLELRARLAETRDRVDEAEKLWTGVLARVPDDVDALEALARLAAARGDFEAAAANLRRILAFNPQRVGVHLGLADLAAAQGDTAGAKKQLETALEKIPHSHALRRAATQVGISDDLERWRIDGGEALRSYQALGKKYEGVAEVLVLDRSVSRVYANGGQRTIVHLVVHLLTKEALDRYGELSIPDEAELLTLHSIKSDGTIEEPERIPGKEGVSLRNLEVGDFVEYEFVVETQPSAPLPGYVDISAFRFQSLDVPYHRSELWVVHPEHMPVKVERRNRPPAERSERAVIDGEQVVVRKFRADEVPRLGVEPGHRALIDELPTVRVFTELDVQTWLRNLGGNLRYAQRANPELRRLTKDLLRGKQSDRDKLEALWTWVVENVEDGGDLSTAATATLASRAGNRLMLLRSMLREAGIRSELWLARDGYGPQPVEGGHPMVEGYDAAMLAVHLAGNEEPLMVLTASKVMPLGYLTPGYSEAEGVRVQLDLDDSPPGPVKLPKAPAALADRRHWKVSVEIDDQGGGKIVGRLELQGMEAVAWRQALRDIDRDRIEEVFQQAELGWLRGASLSSLEIKNEAELARPLVLEFAATAPEIGITQGGTLMLRSSPLPLNLGARYTGLPRRSTGMVVPYAPVQEAEIEFKLRAARFTEIPKSHTIESPFGTFRRELIEGGVGENRIVLEYASTLRTGVVEPDLYPALAHFTRQVEASEQALIRAGS